MTTKRTSTSKPEQAQTDEVWRSPLDLTASELKEYMQGGRFDLQKLFDKFGTLFVQEAYERLYLQRMLFEQLRIYYQDPGPARQDPNTYNKWGIAIKQF